MRTVEREPVTQYGRAERARLALALVDSLGLDGAVLACHTGGWDRVLDVLAATGCEARWRTAAAAAPRARGSGSA